MLHYSVNSLYQQIHDFYEKLSFCLVSYFGWLFTTFLIDIEADAEQVSVCPYRLLRNLCLN